MNATHTNSIDANRMERGQHRNRLVVNTLAVFAACVLAVGCAAGSSETSPTSTQTSSDGTVADATISGLAPPAPTVPDQPPDPGDAQTEADEEAMFESEDFQAWNPSTTRTTALTLTATVSTETTTGRTAGAARSTFRQVRQPRHIRATTSLLMVRRSSFIPIRSTWTPTTSRESSR